MRKYLFLFFIPTLFLLGCSINAPRYSSTLGNGKVPEIAVIYFDETHMSSNYDGTIEFGKLLAEYVAGVFQEMGYSAFALENEESISKYNYLIRGKITSIHQGNWNTWRGAEFGTGRAMIAAGAELIRISNGKEIRNYKGRSSSFIWQDRDSILRRASAKLARAMVKSFNRVLND